MQRIQLAEALNRSVGRSRGRGSEAGTCMLAVGAIAAMAGVSETTVRRALRQAKVLGLITVEERRLSRFRNEPNVVSIISSAQTSWLHLARQGCQSWQGTNTPVIRRGSKRPSGALRVAGRAGQAAGEAERANTRMRRARCPS